MPQFDHEIPIWSMANLIMQSSQECSSVDGEITLSVGVGSYNAIVSGRFFYSSGINTDEETDKGGF